MFLIIDLDTLRPHCIRLSISHITYIVTRDIVDLSTKDIDVIHFVP